VAVAGPSPTLTFPDSTAKTHEYTGMAEKDGASGLSHHPIAECDDAKLKAFVLRMLDIIHTAALSSHPLSLLSDTDTVLTSIPITILEQHAFLTGLHVVVWLSGRRLGYLYANYHAVLYKDGCEVDPASPYKQQDCHDSEAANCGDLDETFYAHLHSGCDDYHCHGKCDCDIYDH
jgi:hypothetical protein